MNTKQYKGSSKNANIVAKSIIDHMDKIYESGFYPSVDVITPESTLYGDSTGEFAMPKELRFYLTREFSKIISEGNIILVKNGRRRQLKTDIGFLDACEEQVNYYKKKLFLFSPERIELSCDRLSHYTASDIDDFQENLLITNYQMHLNIFKKLFPKSIGSSEECQMPVLHARKPGKKGISIVNIGVGPANAKTFTDQIAVLRPSSIVMIGHCGGLIASQQIGDFILADRFIRDDHVLSALLSNDTPVGSTLILNNFLLNEIQKKKIPFHIGTVFTTNNRDWEYKISYYREKFEQSRSCAIDMESSVICAQGFRYKIPNATLLMVSDRPLHGKPKLASASKEFYKKGKELHIKIAVKAIEALSKASISNYNLSGFGFNPELSTESMMS
ncbi:AMP nucleosidase [Candidatus Peregrinibacteria bacterium]|nr:AMP nucleosidase [Candidatus Peregrinibacteria bacterium]